MSRSRKLDAGFAVALFGVLAACGGGSSGDDDDGADDGGPGEDGPTFDAPPAGPCWPVQDSTPGGEVVLGTGNGDFAPMPDSVRVVYGTQGGFHVEVHARMSGLTPGNPADLFDPNNPRTRFRVFFVDTGEPIDPAVCPTRLAYKDIGGGEYELLHGYGVQFDTALPTEEIFGRQVRVVVEIIDQDGTYATDEKVVLCEPPFSWADAGPG